jgi:tight adherence protein B
MMQLLTPLIYVAAFLAVVLGAESVMRMLFSAQDQKKRVNRRLTLLASGMSRENVYTSLVRKSPDSDAHASFIVRNYEAFDRYCRKAGAQIDPRRVLMIFAGSSAALWLIGLLASRHGTTSGIATHGFITLLASVAMSACGVWFWLSRTNAKRLAALEEQMPLALDVVTRAIRAGHPVVSAVQLAGEEMGDPIGSEFGLIVDETTYGYTFREALQNFARRSGSRDAHFFAVSVAIQSETGGNLAEILEGLAAVIRGRSTLFKRVKALSSEGRASAILLSVLPVLVVGALLLFRPDFYTSKFSDPVFWPAVGVILVLYLLGWVMIHRILNFRY